jgi:uncharacterized protein
MVYRTLGLALSLLLAVAVAPACVAEVTAPSLPEPSTDLVLDYAGVLDATTEARIRRLAEATLTETGVTVRVITMSDIAKYGGAGTRLDAYAKAILAQWGQGDPERNDGILLLVETGPREARIALGAGYDAVYAARAARVLSSAILPDLRQGQIGAAVEAGLFSIRDRLVTPFLTGQPIGVADGFDSGKVAITTLAGLAAFGAVGGAMIVLVLNARRKRKTCPQCGAQTLTRSHEVIMPPTAQSTGTGLEHRLCTSCGFTDRRSYGLKRRR